jgi:hypothetical protein
MRASLTQVLPDDSLAAPWQLQMTSISPQSGQMQVEKQRSAVVNTQGGEYTTSKRRVRHKDLGLGL